MYRTISKKLMIPAGAAAALAMTTLAACGGQTATITNTADASSAATSTAATSTAASSTGYTDGTYAGDAVGIQWGDVQVQVTIADGQISNVEFLTYPTDQRSQAINSQAAPVLMQEAIAAQSASVDTVSGATFTSMAFMQSLNSALEQA